MASSKRSLDLDSLTYQDLYTKSQNLSLFSSLTIPVIPASSNIYRKFDYMTPEQGLSTNGIIITPSTIPGILSSITAISSQQTVLEVSMSTISTFVGQSISSVQFVTNKFSTSANIYAYSTIEFRQLIHLYKIINNQNIATTSLNTGLKFLGSGISSLSSQFTPLFCTLGTSIENIFNQGPAVSTLSTFFTTYYINISTNISQYSTSIGSNISSITNQNLSSFAAYNRDISTAAAYVGNTNNDVSTLSTVINSTMNSYYSTINAYDPTNYVNYLSTYVNQSISSIEASYYTNSGISGICSMSTYFNQKYISAIIATRELSGVTGLLLFSGVSI